MSHFNVCVLVKRNGANPDQMAQKASDMLANFDINKEVEPYKHSLEEDHIQRMAEYYGIDPANLSALAEKLEDWNGDRGGVDVTGLYGTSTKNPVGHTDYWTILAEIKPEDRGRLLFGQGGEEKIVRAVVTPDGEWIDGPWVYGSPHAEQNKELEAWVMKLTALLDDHKDTVAFLADCHI
ncbi:MAG TPA: hypothetical protein VN397_02890 [Candidatus Methylomirabilis sp.]|nr:hypothetical protein [Candidatus Methylomirabilis sp.]